jgi:hypothetical protein
MVEARRTYAPVVLAGLGSAALASVAGHRAWAGVGDGAVLVTDTDAGTMPLAGALGLVVLAAWGVLLVTRGRFRRLVAVVGAVAALAMSCVVLVGFQAAPGNLRRTVAQLAYGDATVHRTGWYWVALVAAVVSTATITAAVALVRSWPEMGTRYDAPGAVPPREETGLDLWRALDDGRDPTLTDQRPPDP